MKPSFLVNLSTIAVGLLMMHGSVRAGSDEFESYATEDEQTPALDEGKFQKSRFHVTVTARGGYDDNVDTTNANPHDSFFTSAGLDGSYKAGNARTQLDINAGIGATYYFDRPGDRGYDINARAGVDFSHRATPRLKFDAAVLVAYLSQPDFGFDSGINRRNGNYFYSLDKFSVRYTWAPRFASMSSYTLSVINYDNAEIGDQQDRFEHTIGTEVRFLLLPTTTVLIDYRFQLVDYESGLRDSTSHFFLAGVDHSFSPRFNASARAGIQVRSYDGDATLFRNDDETRISPYLEGTVNYALGARVSLSWTNRYSIEEPDVTGSPTRNTFRTGLQVRYTVTPRITATLAAYYQHDENEGFSSSGLDSPSFTENSFDISLAARYAITRYLALEAGYSHTEVISDLEFRGYARNRVFLGLSFAF